MVSKGLTGGGSAVIPLSPPVIPGREANPESRAACRLYAPHPTRHTRAGGVPSTPRPFGSITAASGILDRPPQCAIAHKADDDKETHLRIPAAHSARALQIVSPKEKRAQGMPGACCTRGLVCNSAKDAHTSIQEQPEHSGIPCTMVLRLMPRSPRRRIPLASVIGELTALARPVGLATPPPT